MGTKPGTTIRSAIIICHDTRRLECGQETVTFSHGAEAPYEPPGRLVVISRLYEIERACKDRDAEFRLDQRTEHAAPLLKDLKAWLDEQQFLPMSLIASRQSCEVEPWAWLKDVLTQLARGESPEGLLPNIRGFVRKARLPRAGKLVMFPCEQPGGLPGGPIFFGSNCLPCPIFD